jgi:hypothetical protein
MLSFRSLTRRQTPVTQLPETRETATVAMPARLRVAAGARRETPVSAAVAVQHFLDEMVAHGGGGELPWRLVADSYNAQRKAKRWPRISDQRLSAFLGAMGCTRQRRRTKDGHRPTFIRFPVVFEQTLPQRMRA